MCRVPRAPSTVVPTGVGQEESRVEPQVTEVTTATIQADPSSLAENPATTLPEQAGRNEVSGVDPNAVTLATIEQLMMQVVVEETKALRGAQGINEPPGNLESSKFARLKSVAEAGCSRVNQIEETTQEEEIEHIPRMPPPREVEEEAGNFCIGIYDPVVDPNPQAFDYVLDVDEDDGYIERGLYDAERTIAYFKVWNTTQKFLQSLTMMANECTM